jgi:LysM repeat protein
MWQPDHPQGRYGRERLCPHCGTRVAQRAHTCFFCGGSLDQGPRRRLSIRWADVVLFGVIGGLVLFWWFRHPELPVAEVGATGGATESESTTLAAPDLVGELAGLAAPADPASPTPPPGTAAVSTPTPAVATPAPTGPVPAGPARYVVKSGDTVLSIAATYGATAKDIISANGLSANGFLRVGQELLIPGAGPVGGPGPTATAQGGTLVYTVQAGDTISLIATRFGSTMEWIFSANNIKPTDILHVGQSLLVPLSNLTPSPTPTVLVTPSPTPTPSLPFDAPALLAPADHAVLGRTNEVLLSWTSAGTLAKDQWYVVTLRAVDAPGTIAPYWTKSTSWRAPRDFRPAGDTPVEFTWQVQVLTGSPGNPGGPASPRSASRQFTWD